jgi:hypothetical protein
MFSPDAQTVTLSMVMVFESETTLMNRLPPPGQDGEVSVLNKSLDFDLLPEGQ